MSTNTNSIGTQVEADIENQTIPPAPPMPQSDTSSQNQNIPPQTGQQHNASSPTAPATNRTRSETQPAPQTTDLQRNQNITERQMLLLNSKISHLTDIITNINRDSNIRMNSLENQIRAENARRTQAQAQNNDESIIPELFEVPNRVAQPPRQLTARSDTTPAIEKRMESLPKMASNTAKDVAPFTRMAWAIWMTIQTDEEERRFMNEMRIKLTSYAWLNDEDIDHPRNWPELSEKISHRLKFENSTEKIDARISALRQHIGESMSDYANRAEQILTDYEACVGKLSDDARHIISTQIKRKFEDGILNRSVRQAVLINAPQTLQEASTYAICQQMRQDESVKNEEYFCKHCSRVGHRIGECRSREEAIRRSNLASITETNPYCSRCKVQGHSDRFCFVQPNLSISQNNTNFQTNFSRRAPRNRSSNDESPQYNDRTDQRYLQRNQYQNRFNNQLSNNTNYTNNRNFASNNNNQYRNSNYRNNSGFNNNYNSNNANNANSGNRNNYTNNNNNNFSNGSYNRSYNNSYNNGNRSHQLRA